MTNSPTNAAEKHIFNYFDGLISEKPAVLGTVAVNLSVFVSIVFFFLT